MCGLPNPEGPLDFFCQFLFLDGGKTFGENYWMFRAKNFTNIGYDWIPKAGANAGISVAVRKRAFVLRREHVQLNQPMLYETRYCELPKSLRKTYRTAEDEFILEHEGEEIDRTVHAMKAYTWLRHLASGFLQSELKWDGKLKLITELLEGELKRELVVIWFDYNDGLHAARRMLLSEDYEVRVIYGAMSWQKRVQSLNSWKAGKAQILLAQPRCLQYGVNLSEASTQMYFTVPLSGEIFQQSRDRILVAGKKEPLLTIFLAARDTVDEDVIKLVKGKNLRAVRMLDACVAMRERRAKE